MRFMVVHKRQVGAARALVSEAAATDVEVLIVGVGKQDDARVLSALPKGAQVVLVDVFKRFLKNSGCEIVHSVATVVGARMTLLPWLTPELGTESETLEPAAAFREAAGRQSTLLIAKHALDLAHELPADRFGFALRAAKAFEELARTGSAKPSIDEFFSARGLNLARSGGTKYAVEVSVAGVVVENATTQWHLKQGDATSGVHASRIYFYKFALAKVAHVLVLYVGPHQDDINTHKKVTHVL